MKKVSSRDKKGFTSRTQGSQGGCKAQLFKLNRLRSNASGNGNGAADFPTQTGAAMQQRLSKKQASDSVGVCLSHKEVEGSPFDALLILR